MQTTAEQIGEAQSLIARLEAELAEADRDRGAADATRREVALAAAEGDAKAARKLQEATEASVRHALDRENITLALSGARDRLARLEERAEAERLAAERLEALAVCDRRAEAAARVDAALAALWRALTDWQATTPELGRLKASGQRWIPQDLAAGWALPPAMAAVDVKLSIALEAPFVGWNQARPLVDGDPVLAWARRERGEAVSTVAATGLVLVDPYENTGETDGEEREPAPIADAPDGEPDGELSYGQLVELTAELAAEREAEAAA